MACVGPICLPSRFIIIFRRVDVNKKPFRLSEIRYFREVDPAGPDDLEEVQRAPPARFDQLGGPRGARIEPIESGERLRTSV